MIDAPEAKLLHVFTYVFADASCQQHTASVVGDQETWQLSRLPPSKETANSNEQERAGLAIDQRDYKLVRLIPYVERN